MSCPALNSNSGTARLHGKRAWPMSQISARRGGRGCRLVQGRTRSQRRRTVASACVFWCFRLCCRAATVWPDLCVSAGREEPSTMSTPLAANNGNSEPGNLNELLAIGPDAKARIRTLVVDDEHTLRESCASVLRLEGYDVTASGRGQEALELLKRRPFDIVLTDLYMSQVDGLALLR